MFAFKQYAALYFWNGAQMFPDRPSTGNGAASQLGRLTSVKDLPSEKALTAHVKQAMALIDAGVNRRERRRRSARRFQRPTTSWPR